MDTAKRQHMRQVADKIEETREDLASTIRMIDNHWICHGLSVEEQEELVCEAYEAYLVARAYLDARA